MSRIIIAGIKPYDGSYELDLEQEFSTREWGWIKRFAGYLPVEVDDRALGDPELACVLAVIAMHRADRIAPSEARGVFEKLADAPFGSAITIENDPEPQEEDDAGPPPRSSNANGATSGAGSPTSSENPTAPGGIPDSATSAFAPPTSAR